ncbi:interferon a3-like [Menidia menidia]
MLVNNQPVLCVMQGNNSTNSTEDVEEENRAAFPLHLYSQASKASAEDKVAFAAQVLKEVCVLFDEDYSSSSWEESTVDDFVNMVNRQADELHSCIGKHGHKKKNTKLHMHFKRLSSHILKKMGHSSEAWELIRQQVTAHLMETDLLVASLLTAN